VIEHRGDRYTVRNLAVPGGTFVNGKPIETAPLTEGDRVRIGAYELSFHLRSEPRAGKAATPLPASAVTPPAVARGAGGAPCLARPTGERLLLRADTPTRIGRALDNDIVLEDASVSRHHAVIEARNGSHVLRDLGSQNGTWLAARRVSEAPLGPGDAIRLGDVNLTFHA
jgi:pSer/pThr/pTyr-binding forkhead associated (FHA) protein